MPGHPFYGTDAWKAARLQCLRDHDFRCAQCGASVAMRGSSRVDHEKPRDKFPELALEPSNLRPLCIPCDAKRHRSKGYKQHGQRVAEDGTPTADGHHWNRRGKGAPRPDQGGES